MKFIRKFFKKKYFLSAVLAIKDEASYVKEWLDYHQLVGVDHFYIYDNGSTDNLVDVLQPYIDSGVVSYKYWPGLAQQRNEYNDCLKNHGHETQWLAVIDTDEFIVPKNADNIRDFLKNAPDDCAQIYIGYNNFGSSNRLDRPNYVGGVLDSFLWRANGCSERFLQNWPWPDLGKSIVRPDLVETLDIHFHILKKGARTYTCKFVPYDLENRNRENTLPRDAVVINHYAVKSRAEFFNMRAKRGFGTSIHAKHDQAFFDMRDTNDIYDDYVVRLIHAKKFPKPVIHPESVLAHKYLDGLNGCEIGASPENPFNIGGGAYCNIDIPATDRQAHNAYYHSGFSVNIIADGTNLPFKDNTLDYVLSSHVIEHFFDPIAAIQEWLRVIRPGGYVFMIAPHQDRIYDKLRPTTPISELIQRHDGILTRANYIVRANPEYEKIGQPGAAHSRPDFIKISDTVQRHYMRLDDDPRHHLTVWNYDNMLELCRNRGWNVQYSNPVDDKLGNGFVVILTK